MSDELESTVEEFKHRFEMLKSDYMGFFDPTSKVKLEGEFRDEVQNDVMRLYQSAQWAVRLGVEDQDAAEILFDLEEVDTLLENASLVRNNVSHNHERIHEYLSEALPEIDFSEMGGGFDAPGND